MCHIYYIIVPQLGHSEDHSLPPLPSRRPWPAMPPRSSLAGAHAQQDHTLPLERCKISPRVKRSDLILRPECKKCQDDWGLGQMFGDDEEEGQEQEKEEEEEEILAAERAYDEMDFDPDCDCYRGRGYCTGELCRYGDRKQKNIGAHMARKWPSFRDLSDSGEEGRKGSVNGFSVIRRILERR